MRNRTASTTSAGQRPDLVLFTGHSADVLSLYFSPDGRTLATCGFDRSVILWDVSAGRMERKLLGSSDYLSLLGYSPDGTTIATTDEDGLSLWNPNDGRRISVQRSIYRAWTFTSGGDLLAERQRGEWFGIWDSRRKRAMRQLQHTLSSVHAAALSPNDATAAVTDMATVQLLDTRSGAILHTLSVSKEQLRSDKLGAVEVHELVFSPDGKILAAVAFASVRLWDVQTGEYLTTLRNGFHDAFAAAFSPDGNTIATAWGDGSVLVSHGSEVIKINAHRGWVRCLAYSPDGSILVTGGNDHTVRMWDPETGEIVRSFSGQRPVFSIAVAEDAEHLLSVHADGAIRMWTLGDGVTQRTVTALEEPVRSVIPLSGDRAVAVTDRSAQVLDLKTGKPLPSPWEQRTESAPALSPDGRLIALPDCSGAINLVDVSTGEIERTLPGCGPVAFSPDGCLLACGGEASVLGIARSTNMWNVATGDLTHTVVACHPPQFDRKAYAEGVTALAFSPDGNSLAVGHDCFIVTLWDTLTGLLLRELTWQTYSDTVSALAFSPNGRTLAVGIAYDNAVHLWSTRTGKERRALMGHSNHVDSLAYLPSGRILASASADGSVKLWNPRNGRLLVTLVVLPPESDKAISSDWIAYTPEGYYDCSPGAGRFIRWQIGAEMLPVETYAETFHRPELLTQTLTGTPSTERPTNSGRG